MKHLLSILLLFLLSFSSKAQQNLVPNPSFEDTVYCPWGTNQLDACANWLNFGNSPDYFNICTGFGGPPLNYNFGFQYPHSGNAMAGIVTYYKPNSSVPDNYREFIGVQLNSSLIIGQKYFYSFYINFSAQFQNSIASNKMGLNFTTVPFNEFNPPPLLNISNLNADSIIKDSIIWYNLSGSFIADSAYQYLAIGNFFDDNHTDTIGVGTYPLQSYYYIDDVCVSTDSIYNYTWTGIGDINTNDKGVNYFPNPTSDILYIESNSNISFLSISDLYGNQFYEFIPNGNSIKVNVGKYNTGWYIIKVNINNSTRFYKFLKL